MLTNNTGCKGGNKEQKYLYKYVPDNCTTEEDTVMLLFP